MQYQVLTSARQDWAAQRLHEKMRTKLEQHFKPQNNWLIELRQGVPPSSISVAAISIHTRRKSSLGFIQPMLTMNSPNSKATNRWFNSQNLPFILHYQRHIISWKYLCYKSCPLWICFTILCFSWWFLSWCQLQYPHLQNAEKNQTLCPNVGPYCQQWWFYNWHEAHGLYYGNIISWTWSPVECWMLWITHWWWQKVVWKIPPIMHLNLLLQYRKWMTIKISLPWPPPREQGMCKKVHKVL